MIFARHPGTPQSSLPPAPLRSVSFRVIERSVPYGRNRWSVWFALCSPPHIRFCSQSEGLTVFQEEQHQPLTSFTSLFAYFVLFSRCVGLCNECFAGGAITHTHTHAHVPSMRTLAIHYCGCRLALFSEGLQVGTCRPSHMTAHVNNRKHLCIQRREKHVEKGETPLSPLTSPLVTRTQTEIERKSQRTGAGMCCHNLPLASVGLAPEHLDTRRESGILRL